MSELIRVVQLPVIEEQLMALKEEVEKAAKSATSLVCTVDTLSAVKSARANLNKQFSSLEEQRKAVKKAVMGPYEAFEKVYKKCVSEPFSAADADLKTKIKETEDSIKNECENKMRDFFSESAAAEGVGWLKWEDAGIKIDMAGAKQKSHSKIRDQIFNFVTRVSGDVQAISEMNDANEIMAEYRSCLNISQAVSAVMDRHHRIQEEQKAAEARKAAQMAQEEAIRKVDAELTSSAISSPVPVPAPEINIQEETVYPRFSFTVINATKSQLIRVREFLKQEGIQYE
jgi:hypothetical protein